MYSGRFKRIFLSANVYFKNIEKIFSPPILGFLASLIILILDIPLPKFFMDTAQYMGNLTTPLALIFIGVTLYSMGLKKIRFDLGLIGICLGRFIIAPLSMYLLSFIFPMPELMFKVFVIMASLPAMIQTVVLSSLYNTDTEYATLVVSATTLLSIITIPIYMVLFIRKFLFIYFDDKETKPKKSPQIKFLILKIIIASYNA